MTYCFKQFLRSQICLQVVDRIVFDLVPDPDCCVKLQVSFCLLNENDCCLVTMPCFERLTEDIEASLREVFDVLVSGNDIEELVVIR